LSELAEQNAALITAVTRLQMKIRWLAAGWVLLMALCGLLFWMLK
jgi:hypothetical protein